MGYEMGNCFNPLVEMIPDTDTQNALEKAKQIATILGIKEAAIIGWVLYIRFSKNIPEKEKNFAKLKEILQNNLFFENVSDINCIKDDGQKWYEMNVLIITFLNNVDVAHRKKKED